MAISFKNEERLKVLHRRIEFRTSEGPEIWNLSISHSRTHLWSKGAGCGFTEAFSSAHSQMAKFGRSTPPFFNLRNSVCKYRIDQHCPSLDIALHGTWENNATSKLADLPIPKHCSGSLPFRLVKVKQKYLGPAAIQTNDANPCVRVTDMTLAESESHLIQPIFGCENLGHVKPCPETCMQPSHNFYIQLWRLLKVFRKLIVQWSILSLVFQAWIPFQGKAPEPSESYQSPPSSMSSPSSMANLALHQRFQHCASRQVGDHPNCLRYWSAHHLCHAVLPGFSICSWQVIKF